MFGGDPFGDPFTNMRRQMREMDHIMESMMEPFGMMDPFFTSRSRYGQNMIENGGQNRNRQVNHHNHIQNDMMMPLGGGLFGGGLFGGVNRLMQQMEGLSQHAMNDPNSHVYTQSTVISFDGSGGPRVVQESMRKAGDVKETRRSVQKGMDGEAEMEVGHHVGNRAHVIEKKRDKDGRVRQQQRFVNLDEDEAEVFNQEFKTRAQRNLGNLFGTGNPDRNRAIEDERKDRSRGSKSRGETSRSSQSYSDHSSGSGGSHAPIVTIPDDDDDHGDKRQSRHGSRDNYYYPNNSGPTIREISEEEADMSVPKRRKGGR
uniref:Myeloid leukemia factor n=1 Tax=Acrobeloides nanus TaxID=290746 RepID=A0A914EEG6_9BILA